MQKTNTTRNILLLFPVFGSVIFVVLYIFASLLYPGGSQVDKNAVGFSWINNYWCNLLNETAINGQHNPAKPVALTGMFILCVTLAFFWYIFPIQIKTNKTLQRVIQFSGTLAMAIASLLFTHLNHDLVTNLASLFGAIATTGTLISIYKNKLLGLFKLGLLNIFLVGINNLFYYNKDLIVHLPLIQKISFATFLLWVCSICIKLFRNEQKS